MDETREESDRMHALRRNDPKEYIRLITESIERDPNDSSAYFSRHFGWLELGQHERAIDDLNRAIELKPSCIDFKCRGRVYLKLGRLHEAKGDFLRGQAFDPEKWREILGLPLQAYCHALLGEKKAALMACAALKENHWSPPTDDIPHGNKEQVVAGILKILETRRR